MAIAIRRAGPDDAEAVRALTLRAYAKWVPVLGREPKPMTADHARAVRDDRVDLAQDGTHDGAILTGLVHMVVRPDDLLVENLAVDPGHQGKGLGDALLRHAEDEARRAGRATVRLYTNALMGTNLAFYAARGFEVERDETMPAGRRIHMVKVLDGARPR